MLQWTEYIKVADKFKHKARLDDKEDLSQSIILALAEVELKYNGSGRSLSKPAMYRVASYTVAQYWRELFRRTQGIDCSRCSKAQRQKCKRNHDRFAECPKRHTLVSISSVIADNGDEVELIDTIADDNAIDLDQWLDQKTFLYALPVKLVKIAWRKANGYPLTNTERLYLYRHSKKLREQPLIGVT